MRATCWLSRFGRRCAPGGQPPLPPPLWKGCATARTGRVPAFVVALTRTSTLRRCPGARVVDDLRPDHAAGGRRGKERAASLRAQLRLAAGGRRLPRPGLVRTQQGAHARRKFEVLPRPV